MSKQVLIVVHQEHSNPGRVGELLLERGYRLDRRCPNLFDPLPDDLSGYAEASCSAARRAPMTTTGRRSASSSTGSSGSA